MHPTPKYIRYMSKFPFIWGRESWFGSFRMKSPPTWYRGNCLSLLIFVCLFRTNLGTSAVSESQRWRGKETYWQIFQQTMCCSVELPHEVQYKQMIYIILQSVWWHRVDFFFFSCLSISGLRPMVCVFTDKKTEKNHSAAFAYNILSVGKAMPSSCCTSSLCLTNSYSGSNAQFGILPHFTILGAFALPLFYLMGLPCVSVTTTSYLSHYICQMVIWSSCTKL